MIEGVKETAGDAYAFETGDCGAARLQMQDEIYGASTRQMMLDSGLGAGMRVLDLACGTGIVTHWIAKQVGRTGTVVGADINREQLEFARAQWTPSEGSRPPDFMEVNAYDMTFAPESFDMVHCRLLLCHLQRPFDALREIHRVLKPGGVLVCQDIVISSAFSCPPTKVYEEAIALGHAMARHLGVNYDFGLQLHTAVMDAGFGSPEVRFIQPAQLRGVGKNWWHQSFVELRPGIIRAKLATEDEMSALLGELERLVLDERVLLAQARMPAVSAVKQKGATP
ncbi:MAG TPA: methyltransferase domain-containing protein [Edaphobacter sp.]|nr:methyltransferase domain-containing protein [Edaphobacter sp.]